MIVLIYTFLLVGLLLAIWAISEITLNRSMHMKLTASQKPKDKKKKFKIRLVISLPFSKAIVRKFKLEEKLQNKLDAAHVNLKPHQFISQKIFLIAVIFAANMFVFKVTEPPILLFALFICWALPDILLQKAKVNRKDAIVRSLPETVDLLGLCVEAGLDFTTSLKWIIEKVPMNPTIEELTIVLEQIKWGKPRTEALRDMSRRLNINEVTSLVQTLVQAERMGTPVGQTFAILSEDTRNERFHRGERIAMVAPIKMLVPLIFCIMPVIAIVVGAPILLQFMEGGMTKAF